MTNGKYVDEVWGVALPIAAENHHDVWDRALEDALKKAAGSDGFGPGEHQVKVLFEAKVEVTNPADIGEYRVGMVKK